MQGTMHRKGKNRKIGARHQKVFVKNLLDSFVLFQSSVFERQHYPAAIRLSFFTDRITFLLHSERIARSPEEQVLPPVSHP